MNGKTGKAALAGILALVLLQAGACTRTQQVMGTGAGLGAGGGAIVAAATGGSMLGGALVGGLLGTGAGYIAARR